MPRNPNARRCSIAGCKAWAQVSSDPPLCASHAGRTQGAGPPPANQNAARHGFYSKFFLPSDLCDLIRFADDLTLDDEIACSRVALRRVMDHLNRAERDNGQSLSALDFAEMIGLVLQCSRTIAHLMRDRQALSGEAADQLAGTIGQALDLLATEWGVDL